MKIGIVCYPTHGGSGVVATELGMELGRRGHEVHFVSYQLPFRLNRFERNVYYHEVDPMPYPLFRHPPYTLALINRIAELIDGQELDLVHAHYLIPHSFCANTARDMVQSKRAKVVTTLHGTDVTLVGRDPSYARIAEYSMRQSDGLTAVSASLREDTLETFGVRGEIRVIPNFVNTERVFRMPGARRRVGCPGRDCRILVHISNFRPVKRVTDVVEVFARVRRRMNARLLMVGDGVERHAAEALVERYGLTDDVRFMGNQDAVVPILSAADLFLLPSEAESFGLSALEAMACEVPVVASKVGGLGEVVIDGHTGFLLEVGDVEGMADSAVDLLSDQERLGAFRAAARERAVSTFDSRCIVPRYEEYFRQVLKGDGFASPDPPGADVPRGIR